MNQQDRKYTLPPISHFIMRKNKEIYQQICDMIGDTVSGKRILVLTAGDDMLARMLAEKAESVTAADLSEDVRKFELQQPVPENLHYLQIVPDALPFQKDAFDAAVAVNLLYTVPDPAIAVQELERVLVPQGVLIAPCGVHSNQTVNQNLVSLLLRRTVAYRTKQKQTRDSYIAFLHENGWHIRKGRMLRTAYPIAYAECVRKRSAG